MQIDDFNSMMKTAEQTASIAEVENALNIRFHSKNRLSSNTKPNDLLVDLSYQRSISEKRIASIVKNFNKNAIGVVTLSIRENGDLYIIDGQHRVEALKKLGKGDEPINSIVFFDLSLAEEAELFLIMNEGRTKPRRYDLHKAAFKSGEQEALDISGALAKNGLEFSDRQGEGFVRAVGTVHKVYDRSGLVILEDTFKILSDANGKNSTSFVAEYIEAVAVILAKCKDVNLNRLTVAIQSLGDTNSAVIKAGLIAPNKKPYSKVLALAGMIIDNYNNRLRLNRIDKYEILSLDARNYLNVRNR
jgi:hypothetical protein